MKVCVVFGVVAAIVGGFVRYEMWAAETGWVQDEKPPRLEAPELEGAVGWLNTEKALTLKDLRGKIVLLDFWTYC